MMRSHADSAARRISGAQTRTPTVGSRRLVKQVLKTGWVMTQVEFSAPDRHHDAILDLADAFGMVTATRGRSAIDELRPKAQIEARPGSMSATFGLEVQPWHMDMAHRPLPARFVLLSCVDAGERECATELLEWRQLLENNDLATAASEPMLVRSGRVAFFATMLDAGRRFLRYDPACISGLTDEGRSLLAKIGRTPCTATHRMRWRPGRTLIFDNWRFLHRRADASHSRQRTLLRISIMEQAQ